MVKKKRSTKRKSQGLRRLFYDIETSFGIYCNFGQGWNKTIGMHDEIVDPKIICISFKWEDENKVNTLEWDKGDDRKLIESFIKVLDVADDIIAHNGDGFDLPWIRGRAIKHGIPMRWDYPITDTLKMARKRAGKGFKFQSNRLDYIAKYLGVGRKIKSDMQWWKDITFPCFLPELFPMTKTYDKAMDNMTKYCEMDVKVLQDVYHTLTPYVEHKHHAAIILGGNVWDCPRCGSDDVYKRGVTVSKMGIRRKRMSCNDCGGQHQISMKALADLESYNNR
jgi:predicted PolB exonuclease-like 3'-5' exonuclease